MPDQCCGDVRKVARLPPALRRGAQDQRAERRIVADCLERADHAREQRGVVRRLPDGEAAAHAGERLIGTPCAGEFEREIEIRVDELRMHLDRALIMHGSLRIAADGEREAETVVRVRRGLQLQCLTQMTQCLVEAAVLAQRIAEIHVRLREVFIERDRASPMLGRLGAAVQRPFGKADVVVKVRLLGDRDRAAEPLDRVLVAPRHVGDRAAQHQRLQMAGLCGKHLRVQAFGVGELSRLMMACCGCESFGGRHAGRTEAQTARQINRFRFPFPAMRR